ncbi:MAG: EF-P beta-lysylation protein EpmB [Gammaproteobacteria bacterium]|nr:EF-P beta-lysylation protein EpmB [Gammaproteobacteria bacterium]
MLPRNDVWKNALSNAVRDPAELLTLLALPRELLPAARRAAAAFPLRVPRGYLRQIEKGNPNDPLLRQVLPLGEELLTVEGFNRDPVGDGAATARPGLLHKYRGRVLLTLTGGCAIHCRYCFRRHFPYGEENPGRDGWQGVIDYLQHHPEVEELILSGGDPLLLDTPQLQRLSDKLRGVPHLKRLRLHSRLPLVLPERIDDELLTWLAALPWQRVVVTHANHAHELGEAQGAALTALKHAGVTLLNQSVLLRGVNDSVDTLHQLSERLFSHGVLPYYLHQLDRVSGAAHFEVSDERARALHRALQTTLPGYLVPRLVREVAGEKSKLPL